MAGRIPLVVYDIASRGEGVLLSNSAVAQLVDQTVEVYWLHGRGAGSDGAVSR